MGDQESIDWLFRFWVQISWPDARVLSDMADGTTERACYFAVVCTKAKSRFATLERYASQALLSSAYSSRSLAAIPTRHEPIARRGPFPDKEFQKTRSHPLGEG